MAEEGTPNNKNKGIKDQWLGNWKDIKHNHPTAKLDKVTRRIITMEENNEQPREEKQEHIEVPQEQNSFDPYGYLNFSLDFEDPFTEVFI